DLAVRKLVDELEKLAKDDTTRIAIINKSIANGWLGVFALDQRTNSNRPRGSGRKSNEGNFAGRQYTDEDWAAMYTEPPEVSE
ncbi:MAG TPA: hypothetical protein PLD73_01555, partial [Candidatus Hydrogenedentes bacterium]|nr:hypothetical protein [Candidatus Hydrogenedentota bacterium]